MKNKKKQPLDSRKNITIAFGYGLFIVSLVVILCWTIIPSVTLFMSPGVKQVNVALFLVSLVVGAVLPILLAYILGDRATRAKNKSLHHYNGVLFGIAAYWLTLFFTLIGTNTVSVIRDTFSEPLATIINGWQILAVVLVMAIVAFSYHLNSSSKGSILHYRPYQLMLFTTVIGTNVYVVMNQDYSNVSNVVISILYILIPILFIITSYKALTDIHPSRSTRLSHAVIAASMGIIAASFAGQFIIFATASMIVSLVTAIVVWAVYLWLIIRKA